MRVLSVGVIALVLSTLVPERGPAQPFSGPISARDAIGVERGSTAQLREAETPTYYLTFDTYGAEDIGPAIMGAAAALPDSLLAGDQIDVLGVLGGPVETGRVEVLAGGLGYRLRLGEAGPTLFLNGDYADITLGAPEHRALDAQGERYTVNFGLRQHWSPAPGDRVSGELTFSARHEGGEILDTEVLDEDLRLLRGRLSYQSAAPSGLRKGVSVVLAKGLPGLGGTGSDNPKASLPGATGDFFAASATAELSGPITPLIGFSVGAVGQWSDDSLPFSQRCGYATNEFSRAFDRAYVNGDRCLGGRAELFGNVPTAGLSGGVVPLVQVYGAVDAGRLWTVGNDVVSARHDDWASVYGGLRTMTSIFIGEITLSHILDQPLGIISQHDTRLWVRMALRF